MKKLLSILMLLVAIVTGAKGAASTTSDGKYASGTIDFSTIGTLSATTTYWNNGVKFYSGNSANISKGTGAWDEQISIPAYISNKKFGEKTTAQNKWGSNGTGVQYTSSGFACSQHAIGIHVNSACTITVIVDKNLDSNTNNAGITASIDGVAYGTAYTSSNYKTAGSTALTVTSSRADATNYPGRYTLTINVTEENLTDGEAVVKMFNGSSGSGAGKLFCWESVTVTPAAPAKDYKVNVASNNTNYGTVETTASSLDKDDEATITAIPKPGYEFTSWAVEGEGAELSSTTTNPTTLKMGTADATVTATFSAINYAITHNDAENGTYTISVAGGEAVSTNTTATIGQTITLAGTPSVASFTDIAWNVKDANNNNVTVTNNQFTMPGLAVTITPVFSKPYFVKVTVTGAKTADVTPTGIANDDISCQDNTKLGSNGHFVGFTFTGENTLKAGDIVEVKLSQGADGTFVFYKEKAGTNEILTTDVVATAGTHRFVMPAEADGETSLYLVRKSSSFNPYVTYVAIIRPDATVTLNSKGFATYSKATDFEFAGAKAYKMALDEEAKTITGTEVSGKIAAGEGILLKGAAGAKVAITETTGAEALTGNDLKGTTTASGKATVPTYCYTLSGDTFKKFKGAAFNDNKAYLESENDLSGQSLEIIFDDQPTAINFVVEDDANVAVAPVKTIKNGQLFIGNYNVAGARIK